MEITFQGKTALVTGGSQGIGQGIVRGLVKCGAKVITIGRDQRKLESLKEELPGIQTICVDLTDWKATRQALSGVENVDFLVNTAGQAILEPLTQVSEDDIAKLFDINVKALINLTQWVSEGLLARKAPGAIVNLSSQASKAGLNNHTIYCATKGAVDAFTRAAALELGSHNIRVNCVNPTVIMTDMGRLGWPDPKIAQQMLDKIPLKRFGEVQEVVDAVLYLLSNKASMITGTCLPIDGGFLAV